MNSDITTSFALGLASEPRYTYFGARYYDSDLSVWLSVDPLASKYPNKSPYCYAGLNPVMITDPNGMWEDEGNGNWKAEKGDSWWKLHKQSGMSWKETMDFAKKYNADKGRDNWKSVRVGDKVSIPGNSSENSSSTSTSGAETSTPSNYSITPSAGTAESVSVIGVLGDLALDAVETGLQELGMSERAAENTTYLVSLGMMLITKKPRIRGTNLKNPSSLRKSLSYDRPNNYIPGPLYPNKGGGSDNWIWWTAGAGFVGGVTYYRIKHQQSQLDTTPMIQPLPQDNTRVQPIVRPYYGQ